MRSKWTLTGMLFCLILNATGCDNYTCRSERNEGAAPASVKVTGPEQESELSISIQTTDCLIEILDYSTAAADSLAEFYLKVNWQGDSVCHCKLLVKYELDVGPLASAQVSLLDQHDQLLWQYVFQGSTLDVSWTRIEERTMTDEMVFTRFERGDSIVESYILNGDSVEFAYSSSLAEKLSSGSAENLTQEELEAFAEIESMFLAFYADAGSLDDNAYGRFVTELLTSPKFGLVTGNWIASDECSLPLVKREVGRLELVCAIASICSSIKCFAGGIANPLCVSCFGDGIACAIATIFMAIFPSD